MARIPFEQVEIELEKLYDFSITDKVSIEERCDLIREFVIACGWTTEEYIRKMFGFDDGN